MSSPVQTVFLSLSLSCIANRIVRRSVAMPPTTAVRCREIRHVKSKREREKDL